MTGLPQHINNHVLLVADSNVLARNLLSRALNRDGYHVLAASNGDEAIELARQFTGRMYLLLSSSLPDGGKASDYILRERPETRVLTISPATHAALIAASREQPDGAKWALPEDVRAKLRQALTDQALPIRMEI